MFKVTLVTYIFTIISLVACIILSPVSKHGNFAITVPIECKPPLHLMCAIELNVSLDPEST